MNRASLSNRYYEEVKSLTDTAIEQLHQHYGFNKEEIWSLVASDLANLQPLKLGWLEDGALVNPDDKNNKYRVRFPKSAARLKETLYWRDAVVLIERRLEQESRCISQFIALFDEDNGVFANQGGAA